MIQRPTSSTLFPYTTLFRSTVIVSDREGDAVILGVVVRSGVGVDFKVDGGTVSRIRGPREAQRVPRPRRDAEVRDRKSTRLNSSHRCISYAVFCLKKKKKHK